MKIYKQIIDGDEVFIAGDVWVKIAKDGTWLDSFSLNNTKLPDGDRKEALEDDITVSQLTILWDTTQMSLQYCPVCKEWIDWDWDDETHGIFKCCECNSRLKNTLIYYNKHPLKTITEVVNKQTK